MMLFPDIFTEMAVLLLIAAVVGALGVSLRQPLIVAFIAVGILVGPSILGWVSADDQILHDQETQGDATVQCVYLAFVRE